MWPSSGWLQNNVYRTALPCLFLARDECVRSAEHPQHLVKIEPYLNKVNSLVNAQIFTLHLGSSHWSLIMIISSQKLERLGYLVPVVKEFQSPVKPF